MERDRARGIVDKSKGWAHRIEFTQTRTTIGKKPKAKQTVFAVATKSLKVVK